LQRPDGTSLHHLAPIGIGDKHFLALRMLLLNVLCKILNKQLQLLKPGYEAGLSTLFFGG